SRAPRPGSCGASLFDREHGEGIPSLVSATAQEGALMKIRVGVDAERSRLGRLTMSASSGTNSPVDVCATGNARDPLRPGGPAPFGTYTLKEARPVDGAMVAELGDTTPVFEPAA